MLLHGLLTCVINWDHQRLHSELVIHQVSDHVLLVIEYTLTQYSVVNFPWPDKAYVSLP